MSPTLDAVAAKLKKSVAKRKTTEAIMLDANEFLFLAAVFMLFCS